MLFNNRIYADFISEKNKNNIFYIYKGMYLSDLLKEWGQVAGWKIIWDYPRDLLIEQDSSLKGSFHTVITKISTYLLKSSLRFDFYKKNKTLVVTDNTSAKQ